MSNFNKLEQIKSKIGRLRSEIKTLLPKSTKLRREYHEYDKVPYVTMTETADFIISTSGGSFKLDSEEMTGLYNYLKELYE